MKYKKAERFQKAIVKWYKANGRRLPWRNKKDSYKILIAEFMLQKTDVDKVKVVYKEFLKRWPTLKALSRARITAVSKAIKLLGLRYKAGRLKETAKALVKNFSGEVPKSEDELLELPGVGRYIASAVLCFAYSKPKAVLDTNVIRILSRVFGIKSEKNRPRNDIQLWNFAKTLVPRRKAKEYNWGLLDFGALICRSKNPLCNKCTLKNMCIFYKELKRGMRISLKKQNHKPTAADLFSGAGGLSLGFEKAGFNLIFAVDNDKHCAETYRNNRKGSDTELILSDIAEVDFKNLLKKNGLRRGQLDILLCGPPCQGFSTANMRTRTSDNPQNHLFREFLRAVKEICPKWILFENVAGIASFEKGEVIEIMETELHKGGYSCTWDIINAADYGVPQTRRRFFLIGNRVGIKFAFPQALYGVGRKQYLTVRDAISDLPSLENGNRIIDSLPYRHNGAELSKYQREMRRGWNRDHCLNNGVSKNSDLVLSRYKFIAPGGNWQDIPDYLMANYKNKSNCHSGIYRRLNWDEPSIVISNFRKCMLIHPSQSRGLSVREAARFQSFPDYYIFNGALGYQQQQVANAVPPLLAKSIAGFLLNL